MPDFAHFDPRNPVKSRPKYFLREGRPIGYELFPGSTFEGKTLEAALEKLEQRFGIRRVIIVADRGLNNKFNLKRIIDKGYGYIVASRIKNMSNFAGAPD